MYLYLEILKKKNILCMLVEMLFACWLECFLFVYLPDNKQPLDFWTSDDVPDPFDFQMDKIDQMK